MIPQVYILEGADGAGKTTTAETLLAAYPDDKFIYVHNGISDAYLPGSLFRHYRAQILEAIDWRERGVTTIIDRSFLSEAVYGHLYRGKSRISDRQVRRLERLAVKHDVVLLGLEAHPDVRRARLESRGEEWDGNQSWVAAFYAAHFRESDSWIIADSSSAAALN